MMRTLNAVRRAAMPMPASQREAHSLSFGVFGCAEFIFGTGHGYYQPRVAGSRLASVGCVSVGKPKPVFIYIANTDIYIYVHLADICAHAHTGLPKNRATRCAYIFCVYLVYRIESTNSMLIHKTRRRVRQKQHHRLMCHHIYIR